jgi:hypothetical protein
MNGSTLPRFNSSNNDTKIYLIEILMILFATGLNSGQDDPFLHTPGDVLVIRQVALQADPDEIVRRFGKSLWNHYRPSESL